MKRNWEAGELCHRYNLRATPAEIGQWFRAEVGADTNWTQITFFPLVDVPVIRESEQGRILQMMSWGLVPYWWKPGKKTWKAVARSCFNAKSETAHEKPSFRKAFASRRCLIPASSFFEKGFDFSLEGGPCFAMAGLWDRCLVDGTEHLSCTILTTRPNARVEAVHHRMPVILDGAEQIDRWLSSDLEEPQGLQQLFEPIPAERMIASPALLS